MTPGRSSQAFGVVIGKAAPLHPVSGNVVPLLAGYFAGFATYADGRVGEECTFRHEGGNKFASLSALLARRPFSTAQRTPLVSIMRTFGSSEIAIKSLP